MFVLTFGLKHTYPLYLQVAVKAIIFPRSFEEARKNKFLRVS